MFEQEEYRFAFVLLYGSGLQVSLSVFNEIDVKDVIQSRCSFDNLCFHNWSFYNGPRIELFLGRLGAFSERAELLPGVFGTFRSFRLSFKSVVEIF